MTPRDRRTPACLLVGAAAEMARAVEFGAADIFGGIVLGRSANALAGLEATARVARALEQN